jgi:hypothetical protein
MSEPIQSPGIDPRGPRFAAWITTVVLAVVLLTSSGWLLAVQAVIFAVGAFIGLKYAPYGLFYRTVLRAPINRRWGPPAELEAEAPPRFAQGVGFAFAVVGAIGYLSGGWIVGLIATAFAFVAAFLNAAFGYCLGCQVYLLIQRFVKWSTTDKGVTA